MFLCQLEVHSLLSIWLSRLGQLPCNLVHSSCLRLPRLLRHALSVRKLAMLSIHMLPLLIVGGWLLEGDSCCGSVPVCMACLVEYSGSTTHHDIFHFIFGPLPLLRIYCVESLQCIVAISSLSLPSMGVVVIVVLQRNLAEVLRQSQDVMIAVVRVRMLPCPGDGILPVPLGSLVHLASLEPEVLLVRALVIVAGPF